MTSRHLWLGTVLFALPWCGAAHAQDSDARALQLYEAGSAAYTEGRYEDSIDAFSEAYRLSPRPLLLYNLANAYERVGRSADAAQMLEGYLPSAPMNERAVLQSRITNLRARAASEPARSNSGGGSNALLVPGIALAAGGVALAAAGVVFGVLALDARAGVQGSDDSPCRDAVDGRLLCTGGAEGRIADAELFALLADIGMIGGGAIAATGIVLIIVGAVGDSGGEQAMFAPDVRVGPTGASIGLTGRF